MYQNRLTWNMQRLTAVIGNIKLINNWNLSEICLETILWFTSPPVMQGGVISTLLYKEFKNLFKNFSLNQTFGVTEISTWDCVTAENLSARNILKRKRNFTMQGCCDVTSRLMKNNVGYQQ